MSMAHDEPKLLFPGLAGFYASWRDIADTAVRVIVGYNLFMHGWVKLTVMGAAGVSGFMAKMGLHPGLAFAWVAIFLETVGALCIIFGLFTRFFAAAIAIEMLIGMFAVHWAHGFSARQRRLRIHPADRDRDVRHRHTRRRAILDRPHDRQGALTKTRRLSFRAAAPTPCCRGTPRRRRAQSGRRRSAC